MMSLDLQQAPPMMRIYLIRRAIMCAFVVASLVIVHGAAPSGGNDALAAEKSKPAPAPVIEGDFEKLPSQVAEMRDAILSAARSGEIKELEIPIQWNELKPDFGAVDADKPIAAWKNLSIDGEGREILAILVRILESPYAVVRQGADIENNKIYVWPFLAELALDKLTPAQDTELLRIVPREAYKAMKDSGKYSYWQLAIGADGTWHAFTKAGSKSDP